MWKSKRAVCEHVLLTAVIGAYCKADTGCIATIVNLAYVKEFHIFMLQTTQLRDPLKRYYRWKNYLKETLRSRLKAAQ